MRPGRIHCNPSGLFVKIVNKFCAYSLVFEQITVKVIYSGGMVER